MVVGRVAARTLVSHDEGAAAACYCYTDGHLIQCAAATHDGMVCLPLAIMQLPAAFAHSCIAAVRRQWQMQDSLSACSLDQLPKSIR